MKVCILGHLRPELNFDSLQSLIDAINDDIAQAKSRLDDPEALKYQHHSYFKETTDSSNGSSCDSIATKTNKSTLNGHCPPSSNDVGHAKGI